MGSLVGEARNKKCVDLCKISYYDNRNWRVFKPEKNKNKNKLHQFISRIKSLLP